MNRELRGRALLKHMANFVERTGISDIYWSCESCLRIHRMHDGDANNALTWLSTVRNSVGDWRPLTALEDIHPRILARLLRNAAHAPAVVVYEALPASRSVGEA